MQQDLYASVFFFQAEDGIRDLTVTGVQTCALPISVEVQDFTLQGPARLVIDLIGARLSTPATLYDGQNRGGVKNIRYAQFKPGVVRVVIDLDVLKDYKIQRGDGRVHVQIGTERSAFAGWSSETAASLAAAPLPIPAPAAQPPVTGNLAPPAQVTTPSINSTPMSIQQYIALHAGEAQQSQAPRINVTWDNANIEDVVAGFAAFSGRTIILSKDIKGKDRKSTRLNSSHSQISYAVFCLKKKRVRSSVEYVERPGPLP